jgi:hypothetical protein
MRIRPARAVAACALATAVLSLAPPALAAPAPALPVPCDTPALATAIASAVSGATLQLARSRRVRGCLRHHFGDRQHLYRQLRRLWRRHLGHSF